MSRPQKIIPPIKGSFGVILNSVAIGSGKGRRTALKLMREKPSQEADKKTDQKKP
jgi:hypothetical protein